MHPPGTGAAAVDGGTATPAHCAATCRSGGVWRQIRDSIAAGQTASAACCHSNPPARPQHTTAHNSSTHSTCTHRHIEPRHAVVEQLRQPPPLVVVYRRQTKPAGVHRHHVAGRVHWLAPTVVLLHCRGCLLLLLLLLLLAVQGRGFEGWNERCGVQLALLLERRWGGGAWWVEAWWVEWSLQRKRVERWCGAFKPAAAPESALTEYQPHNPSRHTHARMHHHSHARACEMFSAAAVPSTTGLYGLTTRRLNTPGATSCPGTDSSTSVSVLNRFAPASAAASAASAANCTAVRGRLPFCWPMGERRERGKGRAVSPSVSSMKRGAKQQQ